MKNGIDVSVIVPAYNAERYIRKMVKSVIRQTLKNIEIIFVDDGSTDNTLKILREFQKKDDRIKIVAQNHSNAGAARNKGMEQATGKYVIFLDADDFFRRNMLKTAFRTAEKNRADIVIFGHYLFDDEEKAIVGRRTPKGPEGVFSPQDVGIHIFELALDVPWNKLVLRSLIEAERLEYQEIENTNDVFFNQIILLLAERIVCLKKRLMFYRVNNHSSLQGNRTKNYHCIDEMLFRLKKEMLERDLFSGEAEEAYYQFADASFFSKFKNAKENRQVFQLYENVRTSFLNTEDELKKLPGNGIFHLVSSTESYEEFCNRVI